MAKKVTAQVFGGDPQVFDDCATVGDVKAKMRVPNHTALLNKELATNGDALSDYDVVSLAPAVKGAQ